MTLQNTFALLERMQRAIGNGCHVSLEVRSQNVSVEIYLYIKVSWLVDTELVRYTRRMSRLVLTHIQSEELIIQEFIANAKHEYQKHILKQKKIETHMFQNPHNGGTDYCKVEFLGDNRAKILDWFQIPRLSKHTPPHVTGAFRFIFAPGLRATAIKITIDSSSGGMYEIVNPDYPQNYTSKEHDIY